MMQGRSHRPATVGVIALVGSQVNGMFRTRERAQLEPAIVANDTKEDLHLNGLQAVEGTSTLRAILSSVTKASRASVLRGIPRRPGTFCTSISRTPGPTGFCRRMTN